MLKTQIVCMIEKVGWIEAISYCTVFERKEYTGCASVEKYKMSQEYSMKIGAYEL